MYAPTLPISRYACVRGEKDLSLLNEVFRLVVGVVAYPLLCLLFARFLLKGYLHEIKTVISLLDSRWYRMGSLV
ncbi:hypothetical protein Plhal710r2_c030g0113461 [Plasmopara halstedii]